MDAIVKKYARKNMVTVMVILMSSLFTSIAAAADYSDHPKAKAFVDKMVTEHNFERAYVQTLIDGAVHRQAILDAISAPQKKPKLGLSTVKSLSLKLARIRANSL